MSLYSFLDAIDVEDHVSVYIINESVGTVVSDGIGLATPSSTLTLIKKFSLIVKIIIIFCSLCFHFVGTFKIPYFEPLQQFL
jgi:hypothetical protein